MDLFEHAKANETPFAIKSGIPVASDRSEVRHKKYDRPDFPFQHMQIGDSFDVHPHQIEDAPLIVVQNMVSGAASGFSKNIKKEGGYAKFTTRQQQNKFVRCWRIG